MNLLFRYIRLFLGLFLFAVAITLTINANLGLGPWDVLHSGLSEKLNITFGQASIMIGFTILGVDFFLGERIGIGSIFNMFFIGFFIDIIMKYDILPKSNNFLSGLFIMSLGLMLVGFASFFYISSGLGTGPRDGLMVALLRRSRFSVALIRNSMEAFALVIGIFMGGKVGIGTIYIVFTIGFYLQFAYKICKFDVKSVKHRYIDEDIKFLFTIIKKPL